MDKHNKHLYALCTIALIILVADQALKIFIKTHFLIGQNTSLIGSSIRLHFIENDGMAYGLKFSDGAWAKISLTTFRLLVIVYGIYYVIKNVYPKNNILLNYTVTIILAGAIGNLIDSMFYGIIFSESSNIYSTQSPAFFTVTEPYGKFLQGKVVDMIYCPVIRTTLPKWLPILGGEPFEFFSPIFNIADTCISVGACLLIIFYKKFSQLFKSEINQE